MRLRSLKILRRINLCRLDGLHPKLACLGPKLIGRSGTLALQHQPPLFLQKLCLLAAQFLALVTVLNRSEVLPRSENEPAGED
jgi:hypothetical protein